MARQRGLVDFEPCAGAIGRGGGGGGAQRWLTVTTWNINSVRLRISRMSPGDGEFLRAAQPDVICLQETKCPDDKFPLKRFARLGYVHAALNGQKGYHGVAILSRLPFDSKEMRASCAASRTAGTSPVKFGERAGLKELAHAA